MVEKTNEHSWSQLVASIAPLTSLAALLIYGLARIGIDAFYDGLDIRAEDVGLTYGLIVSRSAISLILVILVSGILTVLIATGITRTIERWRDSNDARDESRPRPRRVGSSSVFNPWAFSYIIALCTVAGFIATLLVSSLLIEGDFIPGLSGRTTLGTLVLALLLLALLNPILNRAIRLYVSCAQAQSTDRLRGFLRVLAVVFFPIAAAALIIGSFYSGQRAASDVREAKPYSAHYLAGVPWPGLLDVRAECVEVKQKRGMGGGSDIIARRVLYLGQHDNFLVFYRPGMGPLRLPAGDFILSSIEADSCVA
jgi:hypothetical protein